MKVLGFLVMLFVIQGNAFGHALWIETNSRGKKGKPQAVRVYFGEYSENERDSTKNWFSDIAGFQLFVTAPDGVKTLVKSKTESNCFLAEFTPGSKGVYVFSIDHVVKDLYYESLIHYYALASVVVDNDAVTGASNLVKATDLAIGVQLSKEFKVKEELSLDIFFQKGTKDAKLTVQPPLGWTKDFDVNEAGHVSFVPFIDGRYLLESFVAENKKDTHNGKEYKAVWNCVTYCVEVKK